MAISLKVKFYPKMLKKKESVVKDKEEGVDVKMLPGKKDRSKVIFRSLFWRQSLPQEKSETDQNQG